MTTHATTAPLTSGASSLEGTAPVPLEVYEQLTQIEAQRVQQLNSLGDTDLDAVAIAYRESIVRILEDVRTARRRLMAGLYGVCTACGGGISAERLELRPWATSCAACARLERH
jgi:RNA polymerase-binding transcription factor DksA